LVEADRNQFEQVLINLIKNAIEAMSQIEAKQIEISVKKQEIGLIFQYEIMALVLLTLTIFLYRFTQLKRRAVVLVWHFADKLCSTTMV